MAETEMTDLNHGRLGRRTLVDDKSAWDGWSDCVCPGSQSDRVRRSSQSEGGRRKRYPLCSQRDRDGFSRSAQLILRSVPSLRASANLSRRINLISPVRAPGKTISVFPNFSLAARPKSLLYPPPSRPTQRGVAQRHERGAGCDGRGCADGRSARRRTAKACGPDIAVLVSSLARRRARRRWQNSRSPGRARYKP
jgi:hypothetical protein